MSKFDKAIRDSDLRIDAAIENLKSSNRGTRALRDFRRMMDNGASGLDCGNQEALLCLFREYMAGRRDFISTL